MLFSSWKKYRSGQSTVEYAVLIAVVISAVLGMQLYLRRAMMGRTKGLADQSFGTQFDPRRGTYKVDFVQKVTRQDTQTAAGQRTSQITSDSDLSEVKINDIKYDSPRIGDRLID